MENRENRAELLSLDYDGLVSLLLSIGEPKYRADQIFPQLHRGLSPSEMTNVGKRVGAAIDNVAYYDLPSVRRKLISGIDGTVKYLFELGDGNCVESVVMEYHHGLTICISSQVGCRMGCAFCASTIGGKVRDLTPGELLGQIIAASKDLGKRISNIVMMGIGEPLDNYENVLKFLRLVNDPRGICIGYRHISLSTCGLADRIDDLAREDLPITLSISLHAADNETRSSIMPVNRKYSIERLLDSCRRYYDTTGRRISFEYTLIEGKNTSEASAEKLAELLNSSLRPGHGTLPIHVNLIPVNDVAERGFTHPGTGEIKRFAAILERRGIRATVRRKLGPDINASCGQLRRAVTENEEKTEN